MKHPLLRSLSAVGVAAALALLTSCSEEEPGMSRELSEAVEKECAGRVAPQSLDLGLPEDIESKASGNWHANGNGSCWVSATEHGDTWWPFYLTVRTDRTHAAVAAVRDENCAEMRAEPERALAYTEGEGYCSAFRILPDSRDYRAYGAVGRFYVEMTVDGDRPLGDEMPPRVRERFARVMDDLREHYDG
ncbi:hypothetical protein GTU99_15795 [Streptomyces sp. PRKS01-65]|nr:hypothetical protein [Streptomyces harenosi]NEY33643.1 hypothetical protein [Streptomyces harenosi]